MYSDLQHSQVGREFLEAEELVRQRKLAAEDEAIRARTEQRMAQQRAQRSSESKELADALSEVRTRNAEAEQRRAQERDKNGRFTSDEGKKDWAKAPGSELQAYLRSMGVY